MLNEIIARTGVNGRTSNATPTLANRALLAWLAQDDAKQQKHYQQLRKWYDGAHSVPLTARQQEYLNLDSEFEFALNFLRKPISACVERLTVVGFDGPEGIGGEDGLLWQWWQANNMDALQKQVYRWQMKDGDTYIITGWDNERGIPTFDHELAYDGNEGVKPHYVSNMKRQKTFCSKRWIEHQLNEFTGQIDRALRMNIYFPDRIEKYVMGKAAWEPYTAEDKTWPYIWLPGTIPVEHFRWNDDGGNWGESELENLIPAQMVINKNKLDELEGGDKTAFQLPTLTGAKWTDKDGNPLKFNAGDVLWAENKDAAWGYIPAADLTKLQAQTNNSIVQLAQLADIPVQRFQVSGQMPSAESQGADDSLLEVKVESESTQIGNSWENVMKTALKLWVEYGNGRQLKPEELAQIQTQWGSFKRVDKVKEETGKATAVKTLKEAGASFEGAAKRAGYSDAEIEEMKPKESPQMVVPTTVIGGQGGAGVAAVTNQNAAAPRGDQ